MVKAKIPLITRPVPTVRKSRMTRAALPLEKSLFIVRMRELDREFARQTKQLTALTKDLTKKFGKKLTESIVLTKKPKN